ncbi:MAG: glycosyltransferase, partial [Desulfobacteraceae bacterium]|nr:glycosyltransferase [Desulfobacteraceae bacterium]
MLALSRLSHEKGLEYLLNAFSLLDIKDTELIIAGDGPLREKLSNMAMELKIENNVQFIGSVPNNEAYIWYNAADVFCLPSLWEGCPNVIIESL